MTQIDVNTFVGSYPFRDIGENDAADLQRAMSRIGTDEAWVSHLAAVYWRDPTAGNSALYVIQERHANMRAIPAIHPGLPEWEGALDEAVRHHVPAVRCDAGYYGIAASGAEVAALVAACGARRLPLMMTVRLEDVRQRHPNDRAADLTPAVVRHLIRLDPAARLIITHADREFVEQVHFGATPAEAERILWDISWIWGPPEDHLELLLDTVGIARFCFGTGTPLRLAETSVAKLDLLTLSAEQRLRLTGSNVRDFLTG